MQTNAEQFHTDAAPTFNRQVYNNRNKTVNISANNQLICNKDL